MDPALLHKHAVTSLINDLCEKSSSLSTASRYTVLNGLIYLGAGVVLAGRDADSVDGASFCRKRAGPDPCAGVGGCLIGWLYLFGGLSAGRQVVAASVIDRLIFVPVVALALAIAGVFPHLLVLFTVLDLTLAIGAWVVLGRERVR
jgi:hypothetical protein